MQGKTIVILQGDMADFINVTPTPSATSEASQKVAYGVTSGSMSNNFMDLVGLVFLLVIVLFAAYYTTKLIGGMKLSQMKNSNFQIIDSYRVSPNKVIQIIKIANKYIVIAIGKDSINYITELDESEVYIREMNAGEKISFKQTLEKLRNINK